RGTENRHGEILCGAQRLLADALGAQVLGGRGWRSTEGADVHQALHARGSTCGEDRLRQLDVHAREIRAVVVRSALIAPAAPPMQDAGEVEHRLLAARKALE